MNHEVNHQVAIRAISVCRLLAMAFAGVSLSVPGLVCDGSIQASDQVSSLIRQLDSPDFAAREMATAELAGLGPEVVEPLARAYFSSTAEQRWRILAVFRQQAVAGDEATFFRVAAVLRTLGCQRYNAAVITSLHRQWQAGRSARAAERLAAAGADIGRGAGSFPEEFLEDRFGVRLAQQAILRVVDEPGFLLPLVEPEEAGSAEGPVAAPDSEPAGVPTAAARKELLEKLLVADTDEHRRVAMRGETGKAAADGQLVDSRQVGGGVVQFQGNLVIGPGDFAIDMADEGASGQAMPCSVTFGPGWRGDIGQMSDLSSIERLFLVRFDSLPEVSAEQLLMVARSPSVTALSVINTPFSADAVAVLPELASVTLLELDLGQTDRSWLDAARKMPGLGQLRLRASQLMPANLAGIENIHSLRHLMLERLQLTAGDFALLETLPFLVSLNLKYCQFDVAEYRAFASRASQLEASTTGNSFLGVRGPSLIGDLEGGGCQISETVPGSAAEAAGVLPGDVILAIDGVEIRVFADLSLVISQRRPGDTITLEVAREGKTIKLPVALGDRKDAPIR